MSHTASASPVASLPVGRVRGRLVTASLRQPVAAFRGIPYAAAPVGPLRWKPPQAAAAFEGSLSPAPRVGPLRGNPPQAAAAFEGVFDALEFGPDLPQLPSPRLRG